MVAFIYKTSNSLFCFLTTSCKGINLYIVFFLITKNQNELLVKWYSYSIIII